MIDLDGDVEQFRGMVSSVHTSRLILLVNPSSLVEMLIEAMTDEHEEEFLALEHSVMDKYLHTLLEIASAEIDRRIPVPG